METLTTFTSKKASVKVRVNFTNSQNDPAYSTITQPSYVPVYYNCRYMGDPTRPPEIPESNAAAMPGYVELGAVDVPTDGTDFYELGIKRDPNTHQPIKDEHGNTIPIWPVGTHCLFTSLPPADAPGTATSTPWSVPGFNITDSYASNVCASRWDKHDTNEQACSNNYFWVNSQGEKSITLTQDIKRNNAQMTFTKTVSGDAQQVGREQTFTEKLSCEQNGVKIPGTESFTAKADVPVTVTVPAAATCTITEENLTGISDNINVTKPDPKNFGPITDISTPLPVTTDTKFEYKTATKKVEHVSEFDENLNDVRYTSLRAALQGLDKTVTATCLKPGATKPEVITRTITGDGTVSLGKLPASTTCAFKTTVQGLDELAAQKDAQGQLLYPDAYRVITTSTVDPDTTTVDLNGTVAKITTTYKLQVAGAITLTTASTETLPYNSLKQLLPDNYDYTISCEGQSQNKTVRLDRVNGETVLTGNQQIPANTQCTLTQATTNDARLTRTTIMTPSNGSPATHTSGDTGNPQLTFTSPAADGTLNINIVNDYAVAYTNLMLSTSTDVKTSADAQTPATIDIPAAWKTPLFTHQTDTGTTSDYKVRAELVCANEADEYKIAGDFTVNAEGWQLPEPLTVPVGWNCQIDLNQPLFKIPGADLVDKEYKVVDAQATSGANFTWNAVGAEGTVSNQIGLTGALVTQAGNTADANSLALHIPYRMQLGSFNLKKKVGGEGVSMIPGSHQFKVDYSCTLNGVPIPIPTARSMSEGQNVVGTFKNDLETRLKSVSSTAGAQNIEMGRFQQGEWHPHRRPAGRCCLRGI